MNRKTEEMIALGVAYGINCTACLEYHQQVALQAGLTEQDIQGAIAIAKQVKAGAAQKTESVARELFGKSGDGQCCPPGGGCCS